jgi:hypothetical protein
MFGTDGGEDRLRHGQSWEEVNGGRRTKMHLESEHSLRRKGAQWDGRGLAWVKGVYEACERES